MYAINYVSFYFLVWTIYFSSNKFGITLGLGGNHARKWEITISLGHRVLVSFIRLSHWVIFHEIELTRINPKYFIILKWPDFWRRKTQIFYIHFMINVEVLFKTLWRMNIWGYSRAKTMQERLFGLKEILWLEFAACFLSPSKRVKKCGKFKTNNFFQSIESFLYRKCCFE